MKSVLLLNPPGDKLYIRDYYCSFSSKADYYWPPQDLIVLSGILSEKYKVEVIDAIINKISKEKCLDKILNSDYKAIIFTTGTATMTSDMELMEKVKKGKKDIKYFLDKAGFKGKRFTEKTEKLSYKWAERNKEKMMKLILDMTSYINRVKIAKNRKK